MYLARAHGGDAEGGEAKLGRDWMLNHAAHCRINNWTTKEWRAHLRNIVAQLVELFHLHLEDLNPATPHQPKTMLYI